MIYNKHFILLALVIYFIPVNALKYDFLFQNVYNNIIKKTIKFVKTTNNRLTNIDPSKLSRSKNNEHKLRLIKKLKKYFQEGSAKYIPINTALLAATSCALIKNNPFIYAETGSLNDLDKYFKIPEPNYDPKQEIALFKELIKKNPSLKTKYLELIKKDFSKVCGDAYQNYIGHQMILTLLENSKEEIYNFSSLIIEETTNLIKSHHGFKLIKKVINAQSSSPETEEDPIILKLVDKVKENFEKIVFCDDGIKLIETLMHRNSAIKEELAQLFTKKMELIFEQHEYYNNRIYFINFLKKLANDSPEANALLKTVLQKKITEINILLNTPSAPEIRLNQLSLLYFIVDLNPVLYAKTIINNLDNGTITYNELSYTALNHLSKKHIIIRKLLAEKITNDFEIICKSFNEKSYKIMLFIENILKSTEIDISLRDKLMNKIAEHFIGIAQFYGGPYFLVRMMHITNSEVIIESFKRNIIALSLQNEQRASDLLYCLKNSNPITYSFFLNIFLNDLLVSCVSLPITNLIIESIGLNNDTKKFVLNNVINNFVQINNTYYGHHLIASSIDNKEKLYELIFNNFETLIQSPVSLGNLFYEIKKKHKVPTTLELQTKLLDNLTLVCQSRILVSFLKSEIKNNTETRIQVAKKIVENFNEISRTEDGNSLIHLCLKFSKTNENIKSLFLEALKENITVVSPITVFVIGNHMPNNEEIKKLLECYSNNDNQNLDAILKKIFYNNSCKKNGFNLKKLSTIPSLNYFKEIMPNIDNFIKNSYENVLKKEYNSQKLLRIKLLGLNITSIQSFIDNKSLNTMFKKIVSTEQEMQEKGYYTFFHTLNSYYNPFIEFNKFLDANLEPNDTLDYLFSLCTLTAQNFSEKPLDREVNKHLNHEKIILVNRTLFDNSPTQNHCPCYNIALNRQNENIDLNWEKIFKMNNISDLYPKYQEELNQLQQEFIELNRYGTCYMICVSANNLNDHVFLADEFGNRRKIFIEGVGETDNISIILEYLEKNPGKAPGTFLLIFGISYKSKSSDSKNKSKHITFQTIIAADQEKLDAYYVKQHELFSRIKEEIEDAKK
jgi:hypothetical protein